MTTPRHGTSQRDQVLRLEELRGLLDATKPQRQAFTKDNARLGDELEQAIRAAEELRDACTAAEGDAERVRQAHEREVKPKLAAGQALLARLTAEREELGKLGNLSSTVSETQMRINMREKYLLGQLDDMRKEMAEQQRRLRTHRAPTATEVHALKEELEFLRFSASQPSEHALRVSLLKTMNAAAVKQEKLQQYAAQLQAERVTSEDAVIATIAERNLLKQHLAAAEVGAVTPSTLKLLRSIESSPSTATTAATNGVATPGSSTAAPAAASTPAATPPSATAASPASPALHASPSLNRARLSSFLQLAGLGGSSASLTASPSAAAGTAAPATPSPARSSPLAPHSEAGGSHEGTGNGNGPSPGAARRALRRDHGTDLSPLSTDVVSDEPLKPIAAHRSRSDLAGGYHGYRSPRQREKEARARKARMDKYTKVRRKPRSTQWIPSHSLSPVVNKVPQKYVPKKDDAAAATAADGGAASGDGEAGDGDDAGGAAGLTGLARLRAAAKKVVLLSPITKRYRRYGLDLELVKLLKRKLRAAAYTAGGMDFKKLFKHYDRDNSGTLELDEFRGALRRDAKIVKKDVSDRELEKVFRAVDEDGGGEIDVDEFIAWVQSKDPAPEEWEAALRERSERGSPRHVTTPRSNGGDSPLANGLSDGDASPGAADGASSSLLSKFRMAAHTVGTMQAVRRHINLKPEIVNFLKRKLRAAAYTAGGKDFKKLFKHYDRDNSGTLEFDEFRSALRRDAKIAKKDVTDEQMQTVFDAVDEDGGGEIDVDEFISWINEDDPDAQHHRGDDAGRARGGLLRPTYSQSRKARIPLRARQTAFSKSAVSIRNTGKRLSPEVMEMVKQKLLTATARVGGLDYNKLFALYDHSGIGELDFEQFKTALRNEGGISRDVIPNRELRALFDGVDTDKSGTVDKDEFAAFLGGEAALQAERQAQAMRGGSSRSVRSPRSPRSASPSKRSPMGRAISAPHMRHSPATSSPLRAPPASVEVLTPAQVRALRSKIRAAAYTAGGVNWGKLFRHYEEDRAGLLDFEEFKSVLRAEGKLSTRDVTDSDLRQVFRAVDVGHTGEVAGGAFVKWVRTNDEDVATEDGTGRDTAATGAPVAAPPPVPPSPMAVDAVERASVQLDALDLGGARGPQREELTEEQQEKLRVRLRAAVAAVDGLDLRTALRGHAADPHDDVAEVLTVEEFTEKLREARVRKTDIGDEDLAFLFYSVEANSVGAITANDIMRWVNNVPTPSHRRPSPSPSPSPPAPAGRGWAKLKAAASGVQASTRLKQRKAMKVDPVIVKKVKQKLRACSYTVGGMDFAKLFRHYDRDNSGSLEYEEFRSALRRDAKIKPSDVSDRDLLTVFNAVDDDGGGEVEIDEFVAWMEQEDDVGELKSSPSAGPGMSPKSSSRSVRRKGSVMALTASQKARQQEIQARKQKAAGASPARGSTHASSPSAASPSASPPARKMSASWAKLKAAASGVQASTRLKQRKAMKVDPVIVKKVKQKLRACSYTVGGMDFAKLFRHYDRDNSGSLEYEEFRSALRRDAKIKPSDVSDRDLLTVFNAVDDDGGGEVEIDEFVAWMEQEDDVGELKSSPSAGPGMSPKSSSRTVRRQASQLAKKKSAKAASPLGQFASAASGLGAGASSPGATPSPAAPPARKMSASWAKLKAAASGVQASTRLKQRKAMKVDPVIVKKVKQKLRACSYTVGGMDFAKLFRHYDRDNSGSLEYEEFRSALRRDAKIKPSDVSDRDLLTVFNAVDDDGGGEVEIDEFVAWMEQEDDVGELKSSPSAGPGMSPKSSSRSVRRKGSVMALTASQLAKQQATANKREQQKAARRAALGLA